MFVELLEWCQHTDDRKNQWSHEKLDEADLRERAARLLPVVQEVHREPPLPLHVPLVEELVEDAVGPRAAHLEGPHWVRDVSGMQQHAAQHAPGVRLPHGFTELSRRPDITAVRAVLRPLVQVPRAQEQLLVHLPEHLQPLHQHHVVCAVCVEDRLDADAADLPVLLPGERREDRGPRRLEDLEEARAVHVLQGRRVVVADRELVRRLDQEIIVDPHVANVVADGADQQRALFERRHQVAGPVVHVQPREQHVRHVDGVRPVVVLGGLQVLARHGVDEGRHGVLPADQHPASAVLEQVGAHLAVLCPVKLQGVETPFPDGLHASRSLKADRVEHHVHLAPLADLGGRLRALGRRHGVRVLAHLAKVLERLLVVGLRSPHSDLAERRQLAHDALEQVGLGGPLVDAVLVAVGVRRLRPHQRWPRRGAVQFLLHVLDVPIDGPPYCADIRKDLLQRDQRYCGHGVGDHEGGDDHEEGREDHHHDVCRSIRAARPAEVE
mmetsp:Transcript_55280/g.155554  ORF Transcript_55280/g.155554 Transcript_55280/m.155554 type:complete len:496 (+) Transcript_55280:271-1758(+)